MASKRVAICTIEYESLVTDVPGTCAAVLRFLGKPAGNPPQPRLVKQAGDINQRFSERFRQEFGRSPAARVFPASMLERFGFAGHA
ncbi:hypothetical protein KBX06_10110 [Micromonospora sp. C31]|uniref:hypothetical protein n=1 Tax=Micromonospora sp. C31 TaxID=2824876 RepID=UPI001B394266|nr:hypothetical protein [Micromonospora sp. C31]MBQ1073514.1 hypothetical protein [Micromonospora sp. C31]